MNPSPLEPMRVGEILDRSFKLLPRLAKPLIPIYLLLSLLSTASTYLNYGLQHEGGFASSLLLIPIGLFQWIIFYYFYVLVVFAGRDAWLNYEVTLQQARREVTFMRVLKVFALGWIVMLASLVYALLLIIPGIVYFVNRVPAIYILLLENKKIFDSLRQSKRLMTHHPGIAWWSTKTPMMRVSAIMLITMILNFLPGIISGANMFFNALEHGGVKMGWLDLAILFTSNILTLVCSTFGYLAMLGFYYDLRTRAEGLDLREELLALRAQIA